MVDKKEVCNSVWFEGIVKSTTGKEDMKKRKEVVKVLNEEDQEDL